MAEKEGASREEGGNEDNAPEGDAGKKGGKRKLILFGGIGLIVVLLAGGGAFFFMSGSGGEHEMSAKSTGADTHDGAAPEEGGVSETKVAQTAANPEGAAGEAATAPAAKEVAADKPSGFGQTYQMKTFHLNLGNPLENHYIRVDIALEFRGGEEQRAEVESRLPQLRDAIVGVISKQTRDMILDPDGKAQLRREMLIRINRYMKKPIEAVYITDILID